LAKCKYYFAYFQLFIYFSNNLPILSAILTIIHPIFGNYRVLVAKLQFHELKSPTFLMAPEKQCEIGKIPW